MDNVNIKYLKDENNNVISPVTGTNSVYTGGGQDLNSVLSNMYETKTLFNGFTYGNFTLSDSSANYEMLRFDITNNPDNGWIEYQSYESKFIALNFDDPQFPEVTFTMNLLFYIGSVYTYGATTTLTVSNKSITQTNNRMTRACNESSGTSTMENKNNGVAIIRVVGYRKVQIT